MLRKFGKIMNRFAEPANDVHAQSVEMSVGIYLLSVATIAAGILDLVWRDFDPAHQPFGGLPYHLPGRVVFACMAGIWLIFAGSATLWPRTARPGAVATAAIYLVFALLAVPHFYPMLHKYGFHLTLFLGLVNQIFLQLMVIAGCLVLHAALVPAASSWPGQSRLFARVSIGVCGILTGVGHLDNTRSIVSMIPKWMPLDASLWVIISGIGFILAGAAILAGILDLLAARLLVLMFFLFQVILVPIFLDHPHLHQSWGGTAFNLAAAGSVCIYAAAFGWTKDSAKVVKPPSPPKLRYPSVAQ